MNTLDDTENKGAYSLPPSGTIYEINGYLSNMTENNSELRLLSTELFLNSERDSLSKPSDLYLLGLKKALLYIIPVISSITDIEDLGIKGREKKSLNGIQLTSQVTTPAYLKVGESFSNINLHKGDKFRMIGFMFPKIFVNHLDSDIFTLKFQQMMNDDTKEVLINNSQYFNIKSSKTTTKTNFTWIEFKTEHYENKDVYNLLCKIIANQLYRNYVSYGYGDIYSLYSSCVPKNKAAPFVFENIPSLENNTIKTLNDVLFQKIDGRTNASLYETLRITNNWKLYDYINILGFDSDYVKKLVSELKYDKEQSHKVLLNNAQLQSERLYNSQSERIARETFPWLFDMTNSKSIFVGRVKFNIEMVPKKERSTIEQILKKLIDTQKSILKNKCSHNDNKFEYADIDAIPDKGMYPCKVCKLPIVCEHEIELKNLIESTQDGEKDKEYIATQIIINKYRCLDDCLSKAEDEYSFYCRLCGGFLGQSADAIQSDIKLFMNSSQPYTPKNQIDGMIYFTIQTTLERYVNLSIIPIDRKTLIKIIIEEISIYVKELVKYDNTEDDSTELKISYITMCFVLTTFISMNVNKLKRSENILLENKQTETRQAERVGGLYDPKSDMKIAFSIIDSIDKFKRIGVSAVSIKSLLIDAFKKVNTSFVNDTVEFKSTPKSTLIEHSLNVDPVILYGKHMANREEKPLTPLEVSGYDVKNNSKKMYTNIWAPKESKTMTDQEYYIYNSYKSIVDLAKLEPTDNGVMLPLEIKLDDRMKKYQSALTMIMKSRRNKPSLYLPHVNSREVEYKLLNLNVGYCEDTGMPHRWKCYSENNEYQYKCKKCNLAYDKIKTNVNKIINDKLFQNMQIDAFFELYMISCPIKDAHIWKDSKCTQCGVTKDDLLNSDINYFKKYLDKFQTYVDNIRDNILKESTDVVLSVKPIKLDNIKPMEKDPESLKILIESSVLELIKHIKVQPELLINLGITAETEGRSISIIKSFITVIYSHIVFINNLKLESMVHPDGSFVDLVDKYYVNGVKIVKSDISIPDTKLLSLNVSVDFLLLKMIKMLTKMFEQSKTEADTELLKFIVMKIVNQNNRRQMFDPIKIKSTISKTNEPNNIISINEEEDDEMDNPFDGYDIDEEDAEDNIDGDID